MHVYVLDTESPAMMGKIASCRKFINSLYEFDRTAEKQSHHPKTDPPETKRMCNHFSQSHPYLHKDIRAINSPPAPFNHHLGPILELFGTTTGQRQDLPAGLFMRLNLTDNEGHLHARNNIRNLHIPNV